MKKIGSKFLTIVLLLTVMGGCAASNSNTSNPPAAAPSSVPAQNQTSTPTPESNAPAGNASESIVRISISSEPDNFDPMISAATDTQSTVLLNVYEGLLTFDENGKFIPSLAKNYSISDDGLKYSFDLNKGIKFHNGKEFSSEDVKYTYDTLAGLSGGDPLNKTLSQLIASVEAPDKDTIIINLQEKNAGFITKTILPIVPKDYTEASTVPVGTGPYKFVEYLPGQKVVLEKYEGYTTNSSRIPSIDKAEFRIMTDANARLMALLSGGLDISGVSVNDLPSIEKDFNIVQNPSNMVQVLALNNTVKPLDNLDVRKAVSYAVNKDEIIAGAFNGSGISVNSFLSPVMKLYYNDKIEGYKTDVDKAKELLKEAGYENGFELTITVPSNYQAHIDTAQIIKNQLNKAGITVNIELVEWAQWLEGVYNKAEYQATVISHTGKLDPNDFLNRFNSNYANNYFKYSNPEYDMLISKAAAATDENTRADIFKQCQQMLVDDAASVFITDSYSITAISKKIEGFKTYPVSFYDLASLKAVK